MPVVAFTHFINVGPAQYGTLPDPGGTLSWTGGVDVPLETALEVDSGPDGLLSTGGEDFFASTDNPYSGYTVEFNGEPYAIFSASNGTLVIPYNKDVYDIAPEVTTEFNTATYMPTNAMVFNCFATGTTILTPDGERAIETLQPGDRVVTHDGRSTPVIWVARQTVANPRFVELGRKPVRIDAGALGPNLPNRPLTVTADHALLFGDMLVNAGTLAEDGTPIRFLPLSDMPTRFVWWHVELENHEVVPVNGGVPAESFIDYVGRSGFDNYDEYLALAGADRLIPEMPFVRISARRLLPANGLRGLPAIARRPLIAAPRKTAA